jgi:hypothetical protein
MCPQPVGFAQRLSHGRHFSASFTPSGSVAISSSSTAAGMIRSACSANSTAGYCSTSRSVKEIPATPPAINDTDWVAFVQANGGYLAEVMIEPSIAFELLAVRLRDLVDAVAAGERPFLDSW